MKTFIKEEPKDPPSNCTSLSDLLFGTKCKEPAPPPPPNVNLNDSKNEDSGQGSPDHRGCGDSDSSSSSDSEAGVHDKQIPFSAVLSSDTVCKMAKSIGIEMTKDAAFSLGQIAMERIRTVTHHAMQLGRHEKARGLSSEHFTKAAARIFNYSFLPLDPEPESKKRKTLIDLNAVINSKEFNQIRSDVKEPTFNYYYANFHDGLTELNWRSKFNMDYLNSMSGGVEEDEEEEEKEESKVAKELQKDLGIINQESSSSDSSEEELDEKRREEIVNKAISDKIAKDSFSNPLNNLLKDFYEDFCEGSSSPISKRLTEPSLMCFEPTIVNFSSNWIDYYSAFLEAFFETSNDLEDSERTSYEQILEDVQKNGVYPILPIICKFFLQHLKNREFEDEDISKILEFFKALSRCEIKPNLLQVQIISLVFIKILILQTSIQHLTILIPLFCKILLKSGVGSEIFIWLNKYITEALLLASQTPTNELLDNQPHLLYSALSLANQLHDLGHGGFHKGDWPNLLLKILEKKQKNESSFDSQTEESILCFLKILFTKYSKLMDVDTLFSSFYDIYGERLIPISCVPEDFVSIRPKPTRRSCTKRIHPFPRRSSSFSIKRRASLNSIPQINSVNKDELNLLNEESEENSNISSNNGFTLKRVKQEVIDS